MKCFNKLVTVLCIKLKLVQIKLQVSRKLSQRINVHHATAHLCSIFVLPFFDVFSLLVILDSDPLLPPLLILLHHLLSFSFFSLLHEVLFTNHLKPNYSPLAPASPPPGAQKGQNIQTLTDVNLHDFLASISTTVVCLLLLYRRPEEEEDERRGRKSRKCQELVMLCNLSQQEER